jgi:hypothetical protein
VKPAGAHLVGRLRETQAVLRADTAVTVPARPVRVDAR